MRVCPNSLSTRQIMMLGLVVALVLGGWVEWTGRRERAMRGHYRHGRAEYVWSAQIEGFLRNVRRSNCQSTWPGPMDVMAREVALPFERLKAASERELTPIERQLLAEHEIALEDVGRFGLAHMCHFKFFLQTRESVEPEWLGRALRTEAGHRQLRQEYEHAINRPWIAVPSEPPEPRIY